MLVHGLGGSHTNWLAVGAQLAKRGRVVALDLPGFGRSPRSAARYEHEGHGRGPAGFVDAMSSEPVHLVGNSMGGALAILEAHARPQRVAGLLLVCPRYRPCRARAWTRAGWEPSPWRPCRAGTCCCGCRRRRSDREARPRAAGDLLRGRDARAGGGRRGSHRAREGARVTAVAQQSFAEASRSLMAHLMLGRTLRRALHGAGPPALIVHGQGDRLVGHPGVPGRGRRQSAVRAEGAARGGPRAAARDPRRLRRDRAGMARIAWSPARDRVGGSHRPQR